MISSAWREMRPRAWWPRPAQPPRREHALLPAAAAGREERRRRPQDTAPALAVRRAARGARRVREHRARARRAHRVAGPRRALPRRILRRTGAHVLAFA